MFVYSLLLERVLFSFRLQRMRQSKIKCLNLHQPKEKKEHRKEPAKSSSCPLFANCVPCFVDSHWFCCRIFDMYHLFTVSFCFSLYTPGLILCVNCLMPLITHCLSCLLLVKGINRDFL